ncbi:odorant receptor 4-like isoform X1 [Bombus affinis]|uniref:odorant receptor 4-like isoform X1 n=1 Tax=Bombus affinis TaxID=309941 RepID=UPI0021B7A5D4|nr:odorant receptor 4-like isoform X1 [Bombus affinis]
MLKQITPEKVIHITWLSVVISLCWPLPINSNRNKIFCFKILQICSGISGCLLFMPILYSIYLHLNDIVITSSCMCLLLGVSQNIFQTLICFIKHDSLQRTVEEMMTYVREAQQYEKKIFYKYIKKCYVFCGGSMACTYVTATCFSLRPIVLPVSLPFDAEYPFPINYTSMYVIIYMHHACLCIQTAAHICVSSFGALLLWFTVARFECLAAELEKSTDIDALVVCVKKQLHLKRYAEEVFNSFRFLVLYAIGVATFGITLCFLMMLVNVPLFVKLQFIGVCVTVLMEIYLYAWPADYLKDMSIDAPQSIYNSTWYEQRLGMQKSLLNVLIYRRPLTLSIACIVPELSLRYYCSYLSNAFSIFTTLRVMIHD